MAKAEPITISNWNMGGTLPISTRQKDRLITYNYGMIGKKGFQKGNTLGSKTKGNKMTPEQRKRISLAHIGVQAKDKHPNWKGGLPLCKDCGKELSRYDATQCRKCWNVGERPINNGIRSCLKQRDRKEYTSIEKRVYEALKGLGVLFEVQKLINKRFVVDAYIPSLNLVIEADGNYWHSLPKVAIKDKTRNSYLTACGFDILRLNETEINDGSFVNKLEGIINE